MFIDKPGHCLVRPCGASSHGSDSPSSTRPLKAWVFADLRGAGICPGGPIGRGAPRVWLGLGSPTHFQPEAIGNRSPQTVAHRLQVGPRFRVLLRDRYDKQHFLAMEGAHKAAFRVLLYHPEGLPHQTQVTLSACAPTSDPTSNRSRAPHGLRELLHRSSDTLRVVEAIRPTKPNFLAPPRTLSSTEALGNLKDIILAALKGSG